MKGEQVDGGVHRKERQGQIKKDGGNKGGKKRTE